MAPELNDQADLRTYVRILWRWKWLFLAIVILIPLGVYFVEHRKAKIYRSSTLVELQDISSSLGQSGAPVLTGNLDAVARLATTTPVAEVAARLLRQPASSIGNLLAEVTATGDSSTGFLTISAEDEGPGRAAAIANAFAAALAQRQSAQARQVLEQEITTTKKHLAGVPASDPSQRTALTEQVTQLESLRTSTPAGTQVIQAAVPSLKPVGPHTRRAVELALVIALLLGIGAVLLAESSDRRIRSPEDVERLTGWPLLAAIPADAFSPESIKDPRDQEAFQMLGGALVYFNIERPLQSVAVISPLIGDGKTTVAVGLALATAKSGKRVVLVDADLRRPNVCARLGLEATDGLGAVLAGKRSVEQVLLEYPLEAEDAGQLQVLPAGSPPPNPAALLRSSKMGELIGLLEQRADLVIIDTVAALAVSDALPVLQLVSGCVAAVRINRSARSAVRRLQKVTAATKATILGTVVTGAGGTLTGYGAGYYYSKYGYGRDQRRPGLRRGQRVPTAAAAAANGAGTASEQEPVGKRAEADAD
ncbi:MAG: hypothetical protein ACJ780_29130 [Solirubrobacteraceae bacterium]